MNIKTLITTVPKAVCKTVVKHSPEIFLATGIATSLAAVIFAVQATPKALKKIEEAEAVKTEDKIKAAWKCYIPAAVLFAMSATCLIAGHKVSTKRNAALAAACTITETALRQYKDAVVENVAPEIKEKIEDTVMTKQIQHAEDPRDAQIYISDKDGVLCYEPQSGRYFKSSKDAIKAAMNELNHDMLVDGYGGTASLNDFFDKIGLPDTDAGEALGWNMSNGLVEIIFGAQIAPDGQPCLVLKYDKPPVYNYAKNFNSY